jgi:hypothetical protein
MYYSKLNKSAVFCSILESILKMLVVEQNSSPLLFLCRSATDVWCIHIHTCSCKIWLIRNLIRSTT